MRAALREFPFHPFVDFVHQRFRKIAAGHAGLIGNHDDEHPCLVQAANSFWCQGKHTKTVEMIQVTNFFGDGAVAIEEDREPAG